MECLPSRQLPLPRMLTERGDGCAPRPHRPQIHLDAPTAASPHHARTAPQHHAPVRAVGACAPARQHPRARGGLSFPTGSRIPGTGVPVLLRSHDAPCTCGLAASTPPPLQGQEGSGTQKGGERQRSNTGRDEAEGQAGPQLSLGQGPGRTGSDSAGPSASPQPQGTEGGTMVGPQLPPSPPVPHMAEPKSHTTHRWDEGPGKAASLGPRPGQLGPQTPWGGPPGRLGPRLRDTQTPSAWQGAPRWPPQRHPGLWPVPERVQPRHQSPEGLG